jgi:CheY-like chemotaxis protein
MHDKRVAGAGRDVDGGTRRTIRLRAATGFPPGCDRSAGDAFVRHAEPPPSAVTRPRVRNVGDAGHGDVTTLVVVQVRAAPADYWPDMQVLVCDDDASTRFAARRLLEEHFGCAVHEAADGAEALAVLAEQRFTFMLLDIDMPGLSGHDTLEEIRASDVTRGLPVVVLSNERREEVIIRLMQLGVADYILKPIRPATFTAKIEAVVQTLPARLIHATDATTIVVTPDAPALIVDGDPEFRNFFAGQVSPYGPVVQAECGATALAAFRRTPSGVVFVGRDLGVVDGERLARKIREDYPLGGVRLVRVTDAPQERKGPSALWDGTLLRTFLPDVLRDGIRPYVRMPGALGALGRLVPNLPEVVDGVAANVFGTLVKAEIARSRADEPVTVACTGQADVTLTERFAIHLGLHLPAEVAAWAAGRLGASGGDADGSEAVARALAGLLAGRLQARFQEKGLPSEAGPARAITGVPVVEPIDGCGTLRRYTLPGGGDFLVSLTVTDHGEATALPTPAAAPVAESATEPAAERVAEPAPAPAAEPAA